MKILLLADIHIGKRNSNQFYLDLDKKVIDIIAKDVKSKNIDMVTFLGDMFHVRGEVHQKSLDMVRYTCDTLNSFNIPVHLILGNHDIYYNSSKNVNYYKSIIDGLYKNINCVYDMEPAGDILFVGYLQNKQEIEEYNKVTDDYKWIFGHFEFKGIELNDNYQSSFGYDNVNTKSNIFAGHYHRRIQKDNIHYIGTPYPQTWSGKNDTNYGYCVVDTDENTIEYTNLGLFHYFEESMIDVLIQIEHDLEGFMKKIRGNEFKMMINTSIKPKKLNELKMFINTMKPRNFIVENNWRFNRNNEIKYDNMILNSPHDFISDFIKGTQLDPNQKKRIIDKVGDILK